MAKSFYVFFLVASSSAQFLNKGLCPNILPMRDLNMSQISGTWFEIERYPNMYDLGLKCGNVSFFPLSHKIMQLKKIGINSVNGAIKFSEALITGHENYTKQMFDFKFPDFTDKNMVDLIVPYTDYDNFMMLFTCIPLDPFKKSLLFLWVLSRLKTLEIKFLDSIKQIMKKKSLPIIGLINVDQKNCPFN